MIVPGAYTRMVFPWLIPRWNGASSSGLHAADGFTPSADDGPTFTNPPPWQACAWLPGKPQLNVDRHEVKAQQGVPVPYNWKQNRYLGSAIGDDNRAGSQQAHARHDTQNAGHRICTCRCSGSTRTTFRFTNIAERSPDGAHAGREDVCGGRLRGSVPRLRAVALGSRLGRQPSAFQGGIGGEETAGDLMMNHVGTMVATMAGKPGGISADDRKVLEDILKKSVARGASFSDVLRSVQQAGVEATPKNVGVVCGAFLAAVKRNLDAGRPADNAFSTVSDAAGGAGCVPLPGPWGMVASGVSLAAGKVGEGDPSGPGVPRSMHARSGGVFAAASGRDRLPGLQTRCRGRPSVRA